MRDLRMKLTPAVLAMVAGWVLIAVGVLGFLGVWDWVREVEDLARYDEPILDRLVTARSPALTRFLLAVTTISGPFVLPAIVSAVALVAGLRYGRWRGAGLMVGAMLLAVVVSSVLKAVIGRGRPDEALWVIPGAESSASFPSGHTISAATFLLVLGYLRWVTNATWQVGLRWLLVAVVGTGLVAFSRLYLGYHFATDTVASVALAVAVLGVVLVVDHRRLAGVIEACCARAPGRGDSTDPRR